MIGGVTIVVPVWNRADLLRNLLTTISAQTVAPQEVIAVDNGSIDDAPQFARQWGATVIPMGSNQGFAKAVNCGIEASGSEWVAIVNTDVELRPDWLEKLVTRAAEQNAWFAGGKILVKSDPARIDGTFDLIARSGCAWRAGQGCLDSEELATMRPTHLLSATAAIYRRELFARIGNFAEVYESYLEDVDLSLRAAAAGFAALYVPEAVCLHHGSASSRPWSDTVVHLLSRNQALLIRRLYPVDLQREWRYRIFVGHALWALVALRHGRFASWMRGKLDARRVHVRPVQLNEAALRSVIEESEKQIGKQQRQFYWRLYFLLTGTGSK